MHNIYFLSATLLLIAAYIIFRIIVQRDYLMHNRLTLWSTLLESVIWGPYFCFPYIYNPQSWPAFWLPDSNLHPLIRYTAIFLIIFGIVLGLIAMIGLGIRRSFGQEVNILKTTGFYRFSRNPQIVGFSPLIFGIALRWPSWYALGWVLLFMVMSHLMVFTEEEHLLVVFKESYRQYCQQVPRYFGIPHNT